MPHECTKEKELGIFQEFMESTKGMRPTITMIVVAILIQVGGFLYLWGSLVTTVNAHDKTLNRVCEKLDNMKIVGYVYANEPVKK